MLDHKFSTFDEIILQIQSEFENQKHTQFLTKISRKKRVKETCIHQTFKRQPLMTSAASDCIWVSDNSVNFLSASEIMASRLYKVFLTEELWLITWENWALMSINFCVASSRAWVLDLSSFWSIWFCSSKSVLRWGRWFTLACFSINFKFFCATLSNWFSSDLQGENEKRTYDFWANNSSIRFSAFTRSFVSCAFHFSECFSIWRVLLDSKLTSPTRELFHSSTKTFNLS